MSFKIALPRNGIHSVSEKKIHFESKRFFYDIQCELYDIIFNLIFKKLKKIPESASFL